MNDPQTKPRPPFQVVAKAPKSMKGPKGHEAFLKALETSSASVVVVMISSGDTICGKIKCSDSYTISVNVPLSVRDPDGLYMTRVLFKHDISEFRQDRPVVSTAVN